MYKPSEKEVPDFVYQVVQLLLTSNLPDVLIHDKTDDVLFIVTCPWHNLQSR